MNKKLIALLLITATFNGYSMKRKLPNEELNNVVSQVLIGDAPMKDLLNNFEFKKLPPEMQYTFIQLLSSGIAATSIKEAADAIRNLSHADKELHELINDPKFCLRLIKNLAQKFKCADDTAAQVLNTGEAKRRLALQNMLYKICVGSTKGDIIDFVKKGIDLNFTYADWDGWPALIAAAQSNDCPMVQQLLKNGADINKADFNGHTALMIAVNGKKTDAVKCLLSNPTLAINQEGNNTWTALLIAVQNDDCPVIRLLLTHGADINKANGKGFTPFMIALANRHINAAQCLLRDSNLAIDQQNNIGGTALMLAVQTNNCPMIKQLLDKGANINMADNHGTTALMIAAAYKNINAVKCLLSNPKLVINQEKKDGLTALIIAAQRPNNQEIIDLIENAIDKKHEQK